MPQTNSRFLFVVAGQAEAGPDHLARSLILALALADCGGACSIISTPSIAPRLADLAPTMTRATAVSDTAEGIGEAARRVDYDAVIIDHPGLGRADHEGLAGERPSVVLDDLADRHIGGRMVVNSRMDFDHGAYADLALAGAEILAGPIHALMPSEYARLRAGRPASIGPVQRVLFSISAETPTDLAVQVVDHLRPRLGETSLDVLLPEGFGSLRSLSRIAARDPRLALHHHPLERPRIAARTDLAIATIGPDLWEAAALALPLIAIGVTPAEAETARRLTSQEAAVCIEATDPNFEGRLDRAFVRLVADATLRGKLSANSATLTDGAGAARIAHRLIELLPR